MRILSFVIIGAVALWLGDAMLNNGRYGNQIWLELNRQVQKADYEVRSWLKF